MSARWKLKYGLVLHKHLERLTEKKAPPFYRRCRPQNRTMLIEGNFCSKSLIAKTISDLGSDLANVFD